MAKGRRAAKKARRAAAKPRRRRSTRSGGARAVVAFEAYLKRRGGRLTRQRRAALGVLLRMRGTFTCDQIERTLHRLRRGRAGLRSGRAHRATVYRLLPHLVAAGLVRELPPGRKGLVRYERARGASDGEILCTRCGRTEPVRAGRLAAAAARLCRRHRFRPAGFVLSLRGLCPACRTPARPRRRARRKKK